MPEKSIKLPLVGISDSGRTPDINAHEAINLMPQARQTGAKENFYWKSAPGLRSRSVQPDNEGYDYNITGHNGLRALWEMEADDEGGGPGPSGYLFSKDGTPLSRTSYAAFNTEIDGNAAWGFTINNATQVAWLSPATRAQGLYVYDPMNDVVADVASWSTENPITDIVFSAGVTYTVTFQDVISTIGTGDVGGGAWLIIKASTNFNREYVLSYTPGNSFGTITHINGTDADETGLIDANGFLRERQQVTENTGGPYSATPPFFFPQVFEVMDTYGVMKGSLTSAANINGIPSVIAAPEVDMLLNDFFVSYPGDFRIWLPANTGAVQRENDSIVAIKEFNGDLWFLGEYASETFYNAGQAGQPFLPSRETSLDWGCISQRTIAETGKGFCFVGKKRNGSIAVVYAEGYNFDPISTKPVEQELYATFVEGFVSPNTLFCFSHRIETSFLYCMAGISGDPLLNPWVFDVATAKQVGIPMWWKWPGIDDVRSAALDPASSGFFLVYTDSDKREISPTYYQNDTDGVPANRTYTGISGALHSDDKTLFHHTVVIDMEHPVGTGTVTLSYSDDGGHTYAEHSNMSFTGLNTRVQFDSLGSSRNQRVYKIVINDTALPVVILAAYARVTEGIW